MSSWIPQLFNPFTDDDNPTPTSPRPSSPPRSPSSGAKDDLSAVFRGVAAFLAPPPAPTSPGPSSSSETIAGIKSDLAEIQGTFRSGLSLISSKITSNLLQLQNQLNDGDENDNVEEEEEDEGLGITDEILDFVLKISRRPELWTDFPLSLPDDFQLSDYQREHAANIDHLVPEFETLRQKIGSQMSNGKFWLIYFILLLPRLNEEDLKLLSTPQVAEARETLLKKLHNKTDEETSENPGLSDDAKDASAETVNPTPQRKSIDETESGDPSKEVDTRPFIDTQKQSLNEEDVSFSDLEDEDDDPSDKPSAPRGSTSDKAWVQLDESSGSQGAKQKADHNASKDKESEGEDSNDWLTVDDTDFDNLGAV